MAFGTLHIMNTIKVGRCVIMYTSLSSHLDITPDYQKYKVLHWWDQLTMQILRNQNLVACS
jgi:hypothetical protein